jgi:hypothetical protein
MSGNIIILIGVIIMTGREFFGSEVYICDIDFGGSFVGLCSS